jgi:beta-galactosidase
MPIRSLPEFSFSRTLIAICYVLLLGGLSLTGPAWGQTNSFSIDVRTAKTERPKLLPNLGGVSSAGDKIEVNQDYIVSNGVPDIPIMGEFHFTRYPAEYWDESLKKIRVGGINTVATYIFWNIHEVVEGKFNFSGNRNIRKFIELCGKNKLRLIVRIGPFCHGEIRSGGLPDWLLSKPLSVRCNDPLYLHYVERLYNEIGKQLQGFYFKDGGPIIGIQLENEYQHSASPWGITYPGQPADFTVADRDRSNTQEGVGISKEKNPYAELGNNHMRALKALAQKAGIIVPVYTATGWGNAAIIPDETLPVTAAYAYPNWTKKKEPSDFYLYKDMHRHPDYAPVRYQPEDCPVLPAEIGAGIMDNYVRRPVVPAESVDAIINRCLGSGANGIGYYMYHGGSSPVGEHYYFNDEAFGYPKISYDFQAPIGEFGDVRASYHRLKLLHLFVNDFAAQLAPMSTFLPSSAAMIKPENRSDLRFAIRSNGRSGFVFLNNFQDHIDMDDHKGINITVKATGGNVRIPSRGGFDLKSSENVILPFNLDINGAMLRYATVQLLCKSSSAGRPYYVFFSVDGTRPEFCFDANKSRIKFATNGTVSNSGDCIYFKPSSCGPSMFTLISAKGKSTLVLLITKETALQSFCQDIDDSRHLVFAEGVALDDYNNKVEFIGEKNDFNFSVFPVIKGQPHPDHGTLVSVPDKIFSTFHISLPRFSLKPETTNSCSQKFFVNLPEKMPSGLNDLFLDFDYTGDTAMGFLQGELVCDHFYNGNPWHIGLKRFLGKDKQFAFYLRPLMHDAPYLVDLSGKIADELKGLKQLLKVNQMTFAPEYKMVVHF